MSPFSFMYQIVMWLRNWLYDISVFCVHEFSLPVVSVGNLTVGGTGKTPHVEYLVRLLKDKYGVAVLSRGYKRKTKGFVVADEHTTVDDIGDEPWQIHRKFPDVKVIVDANSVDDEAAMKIARDIAKKVEDEMTYPGEIQVTLLREVRCVEYAR